MRIYNSIGLAERCAPNRKTKPCPKQIDSMLTTVFSTVCFMFQFNFVFFFSHSLSPSLCLHDMKSVPCDINIWFTLLLNDNILTGCIYVVRGHIKNACCLHFVIQLNGRIFGLRKVHDYIRLRNDTVLFSSLLIFLK